MASIDTLKASDGTGAASVATVQSVRAPAATTLVVDTVQGINSTFHATMGTPHTFVDPVTSETITVISESTAVDFQGHVDGTNLEIDTIAPGFTDNGSAVNDIVIIKPTTQWADEVAEVLEVSHNDDGTLKANTVDTTQLVDGSVTPAKRSGGFYIGTIASTTMNSTGNKAVTGVGFTPKLVRFALLDTSTATSSAGYGGMTATAQWASAHAADGTNGARKHSTSSCVLGITPSGTTGLEAEYVSLDADGFTINVTTASSVWDIAYEAYA